MVTQNKGVKPNSVLEALRCHGSGKVGSRLLTWALHLLL